MRGLAGNAGVLEAMPSKADIFVLTETWTPVETRPPPLAGYKSFGLSRPYQNPCARRASGGVACYVKEHLHCATSVWKAASDGSMLWIKLSKSLGLLKDLYLCIVYLSPEHSTFYQQPYALDAFEDIMNDVAEIECCWLGV